jgi:hypothetical protein
MAWTEFWDMHSGGGQKTDWDRIYIEAPEAEARLIFYNRFGHSPERVTCTCCGEDYSISEGLTLEQVSGYHRNCPTLVTPRSEDGLYQRPEDPWFEAHYYLEPGDIAEAERRGFAVEHDRFGLRPGAYLTVEEYADLDEVLVIAAADIAAQGYVWMGE